MFVCLSVQINKVTEVNLTAVNKTNYLNYCALQEVKANVSITFIIL